MKISLLIILFSLFLTSCIDKRQALGKAIYHKMLDFQKLHGHLPDNLSEIGVEDKMEGPIYYNKQSDSAFIIYYGGSLGESVIFDPKSGIWKSDKQ
jgi:hypothetical protein